ncbi:DUF2795 domain-containing protein [Actinomadura sp. SCN-SB]|uniref:DUF2795 domain-containing protein n=1 Tax=Actinomadura sp. SCN-SB TaxID=3373092 RepID=UPI003750CE36
MQEDRSDKHSPRLDDELAHETEGMVRGNHSTHAEEFAETEPYSDAPTWEPGSQTPEPVPEGSPPGMSAEDVEERSALARLLNGVRYPARPGDLAAHLSGADAPDRAVAALRDLPDREYVNVADVAEALGYGKENRRF